MWGIAKSKREDAAAKAKAKRERDAPIAEQRVPPPAALSLEQLHNMIDDRVTRGFANLRKEQETAVAEIRAQFQVSVKRDTATAVAKESQDVPSEIKFSVAIALTQEEEKLEDSERDEGDKQRGVTKFVAGEEVAEEKKRGREDDHTTDDKRKKHMRRFSA